MTLKEKLATLNTHPLTLHDDFIEFLTIADEFLKKIKEEYQQFNELLEIGTLTVSEFDLLIDNVKNFKKHFETLDKLISNNEDKMEILTRIGDNAISIIEEYEIVKDVETWRWGDYVVDVKRDSLCSINSEKIELILSSLESVSSYREKNNVQKTFPKSCELIMNLVNLLGLLESEFILNVVYRRPTDVMRRISEAAKEIETTTFFYLQIISENYFKTIIDNCLTNIQSLEVKYLSSEKNVNKMDKVVKLKDIMGPKKRAFYLFKLRDILRDEFKF